MTNKQEINPSIKQYVAARIKNHVGESNAITGRELGIPGADLRYYVNKLRKEGYPICSSGNGYWWAENRRDITRVRNSLEGRARAIMEVAYYLDRSDLNKEVD